MAIVHGVLLAYSDVTLAPRCTI